MYSKPTVKFQQHAVCLLLYIKVKSTKKNVSIETVNINIIKNLLCMLGAGRGKKKGNYLNSSCLPLVSRIILDLILFPAQQV